MQEIKATQEIKKYFKELNAKVKEQYDTARKARSTGKDLSNSVECLPTADLAERTESIIGPKGVAKRYRELVLELKGDRMKIMFKVFKEIIEEQWCVIPDDSKRVEQAIKTCLVLETEGVVVAPLDGVPKIEINKNMDGSKFIDIYFAGPIRAAGGSSTVLPLILGDYARHLMDLDKYKPTEEEVERYVEEIMIYQTEIFSRQYTIPEEEIRTIVRGCPVCINGVPTEEKEVSVHRDLERIPSNRIRGGMGLVISEGVALKAMKIMDWAKKLELDWSWLEKIIKVKKSSEAKTEIKPNFKYLDRIAAGRPLLAYPMKYGGFRLRYGRGRNTGIMAKGINPATMVVLDEFIAVGTHIRIERPGKAAQLFPCDSIDGPIVKLKNGNVLKLDSTEEAEKIKPQIEKILFLGDMLISLGDFRKTSHPLLPSSFVEEWFELELKNALKEKKLDSINRKDIEDVQKIDCFTAVELSMQLGIPLHPKYLFYYTALDSGEIIELMKEARKAEKVFEKEKIVGAKFELKEKTKDLMERIGLPHSVKNDKIELDSNAYPLLKTLGALSTKEIKKEDTEKKVLDLLTEFSGIKIMDKGASFVGARMGRPEQAKPREMKGNPHGLFPIGNYGSNTRSINKAISVLNQSNKKLKVDLALYRCPQCTRIIPFPNCDKCNTDTLRISKCSKCGWIGKQDEKQCHQCRGEMIKAEEREIDLEEIVNTALEKMNLRMPELVKGVKGLISDLKEPEPIEKAILRAKHNVHIFRDGTTRFELLNAPITHFTPREINLSVEKIKELGYSKDSKGKEIVSDTQLIEIFPQDMIVNETAGDWMLNVTAFIDEMLEKFYGMPAFYNKKTKEDLIGEIVIGLAPHTSAAIVGRILGYSKSRLGWSHPYFITCKRRNCLTGNTPVLIQNSHKMKSVSINYFDDGSEKEEIPLENIFTYTIDRKGRLQTRKVNALLKQQAPKELIKFRTRFGREITATANHKLLSFNGTKVFEKQVSEFSEGDALLALHSVKANSIQKEFNVLEYYLKKPVSQKKFLRVHGLKQELRKFILKKGGFNKTAKRIKWRDGKAIHTAVDFDSVPLDLFELLLKDMKKDAKDFSNCFIGYNKQKSTLPAVIPFSRELGEVLGYFLADGYARTSREKNSKKFVYQVNFVSAEKEITRKLENSVKELFKRNVSVEKRKLDYITLSGRVYFEFFTEMLGSGSNAKNKRVPFLLFNSPKECLQGLLAGYIVGDGHIDFNSIKMTSVNQSMINDFGLVCNLLGLFPHFINEKEREIKSGYLKEFYARKGKTISIKAFGIRLYSEDLREIGKHLFGEKKKKFDEINLSHNFRKKRIKKIGNFVLDPITKIERIESKEKWVYDLMVEGEKNYIAGFGNLAVYDCDGDQDSIMLLMDALLNFSEHYLPSSRGGRMDAPLVFTTVLNPSEIDNEVYEMETVSSYPIEFYYKTLDYAEPNLKEVAIVKKRLGEENQYTELMFTHNTETFDEGPKQSMYVQLKTMEEKIRKQAKLQHKISAVEEKDALERVLVSHFLPDIIGNTRAFSKQNFRCTACGAKYRRVPLVGKCTKCGNNLILTIAEGSVRKYLEIAKAIISEYGLGDYLKQRIDLAEREISSVFSNDKVKQKSLHEYF
ncbi:MAG: DNA polymerase II large subunit [archaeon]